MNKTWVWDGAFCSQGCFTISHAVCWNLSWWQIVRQRSGHHVTLLAFAQWMNGCTFNKNNCKTIKQIKQYMEMSYRFYLSVWNRQNDKCVLIYSQSIYLFGHFRCNVFAVCLFNKLLILNLIFQLIKFGFISAIVYPVWDIHVCIRHCSKKVFYFI